VNGIAVETKSHEDSFVFSSFSNNATINTSSERTGMAGTPKFQYTPCLRFVPNAVYWGCSLARHDAVLRNGYCLGNAGEMFEQFSDVFPILIRNQTHRDFGECFARNDSFAPSPV
jgi:hypothetical protein